jgi:hypothetical protein
MEGTALVFAVGFTEEGTLPGLIVGALLVGFTEGVTLLFVVGVLVELVLGVNVGSLLLGFKVGSLLAEEGLALGFLVLENVGDAVGIWEAVFPQAMPELQVYVDLTVRDLT